MRQFWICQQRIIIFHDVNLWYKILKLRRRYNLSPCCLIDYINLKINKNDNKCTEVDRMTGFQLVEPGLYHIFLRCYKNISLYLGEMPLIISFSETTFCVWLQRISVLLMFQQIFSNNLSLKKKYWSNT